MERDIDIVRIEKLQEAAQFTTWKFQVRVALQAKEIFAVVSGDEMKPAPAAAEAEAAAITTANTAIADWNKKDAKAQNIIVSSLGQKAINHVIDCQSSNSMWQRLISIYERTNELSKSQLQEKFFSFTKEPADDMATFISKMDMLVHRMRNVNIAIDNSMIITRLLTTLPQEYRHFVSAWDSVIPTSQTLDTLKSRLMVEEQRMNTGAHGESSEAFVAKGKSTYKKSNQKPKKNQKGCYRCGSLEHWKRDCNSQKSSKESQPKPKKDEKGQSKVFFSEMNFSTSVDDIWYADSGATEHMVKNCKWFRDFVELDTPRRITLGNGDAMHATGRGNIDILSYNGKDWIEKTLANALYVPNLHANLFSETNVLDNGHTIRANKNEIQVLDEDCIVAVGARRGGLFQMLFKVIEPNVSTANLSVKKNTLQMWHERLGHQNVAHIREVLHRNNIDFVDEKFDCDGCAMGKMHRLSFNLREEKAKACGEIVHADVCGPIPETSFGGARYFLLFKDDYSHFRKVYFLKQKSEVIDNLKIYVKWAEKQNGRPIRILCMDDSEYVIQQNGHQIKVLRTDNGTEFVNREVKHFLEENGIEHQRTVPYTPEQNGCAEREMRTIVEAARSMIHAKGINSRLWAEAVNSAVFILNRTGTSTIKHKTPYELWYGKSIEINDFRVFGSEVYVHLPKQGRTKLDAKAKKCIFVGYDENVKGFRVFDSDSNKIEIVRDVKFLLNEFSSKQFNDVIIDGSENSENVESSQAEPELVQEAPGQDDVVTPAIQNAGAVLPAAAKIRKRRTTTLDGIDENNIIGDRLRERSRSIQEEIENVASMAFITINEEPQTYDEAVNSVDNEKWKEAMDDEYNSLLTNDTWILVEKPLNKGVIDNKWVFKVKQNPNGSIERYRARLVGRGFTQQYGVDYDETFSPVVRFTSIRTLLAIAARNKYKVKQFDVKTAFLYGELQEDVYMKQPIGFDDNTGRVCKLKKSLYGLKQASRCWNIKFKNFIEKFGFVATESDPCVFISVSGESVAILAIYVDDGLVIGNNERVIDSVITHLKQQFEVKTIELGCFLGIEIQRLDDGSIFLNQKAYARKVLNKFSMIDCNAVATPADSNQVLEKFEDSEIANYPYRQLVGSLMYLAIATRPDIAFAIGKVSRFLERPTQAHVVAAKRILKYIKGTISHGILYDSYGENRIDGYSDADYAGDVTSRKSTSGYAFVIGNGVVSWGSILQKSISLSTMESEYISASEATRELIWLNRLTNELTQDKFGTPILFVDNQSAIKLANNPVNHKRSKHIDVKYHFIREKLNDGILKLEDIRSEDQLADIFTKALPKQRFQELRSKLNIVNIESDNN